MVEYPKAKYSASNVKYVLDAEEEKELGEGWYDTPTLLAEAQKPKEDVKPSKSLNV